MVLVDQLIPADLVTKTMELQVNYYSKPNSLSQMSLQRIGS